MVVVVAEVCGGIFLTTPNSLRRSVAEVVNSGQDKQQRAKGKSWNVVEIPQRHEQRAG